ncbi:MAG TPA: hypothetical protein VEA40_04065 [Ramlibacter sp.]|nr:hypothetical protein [Ramlibacter sp.]
MAAEPIEALCPLAEDAQAPAAPARRLDSLDGKTIALLSNDMFRADKVLACVAEEVRRRYPRAKVIPWEEFPRVSAMGDVHRSVAEVTEALRRRRPDAVVASTGA